MSSISTSPIENPEPAWVAEVLRFWFVEISPTLWFAKNKALDQQIRDRFLATHQQLLASEAAGISGPRTMLAAVIVFDQFSRNLFRGDAHAFAADATARRITNQAIEQGFDAAMSAPERMFLYLPFEHSENVADQARSVALTQTLGNEEWTRFALAHKQIIDRFGRFPHRNAALGRQSTAEEIEMLKGPMSSF